MTEVRLYEPDEPSEQFEDAQNEWLMRQLRALEESVAEIRDRMRWRGDSWDGTEHQRNDVVRDGYWTMIANKATFDQPAPQPVGERFWLTRLGDTPAWNSSSVQASSLFAGILVAPVDIDTGYLHYGARVWIPAGSAGMRLSVYFVGDPFGTPSVQTVLPEITIQAGQENAWLSIGLGTGLVVPGNSFAILARFSVTGAPVNFGSSWDAKRKNGTPSSKEAWHQTGSGGTRIHHEDVDENSQQTDLETLVAGDKFSVAGIDYDITDSAYNASDVHLWHTPTTRPQENEYVYSFTHYPPTSVPFVDNGPAWAGNNNIKGLYSETGYNELMIVDTMYGVDLEVQDIAVSSDWDVVAYSGD